MALIRASVVSLIVIADSLVDVRSSRRPCVPRSSARARVARPSAPHVTPSVGDAARWPSRADSARDVAGGNQRAGHAFDDDRGNAADGRRHHRQPARHRLDDHQRQPLGVATTARTRRARRAGAARRCARPSRCTNRDLLAERGAPARSSAARSSPSPTMTSRAVRREQRRHRAHQQRLVLLRHQPPDGADDERVAGKPSSRAHLRPRVRRRAQKRDEIDPVRDDSQLALVDVAIAPRAAPRSPATPPRRRRRSAPTAAAASAAAPASRWRRAWCAPRARAPAWPPARRRSAAADCACARCRSPRRRNSHASRADSVGSMPPARLGTCARPRRRAPRSRRPAARRAALPATPRAPRRRARAARSPDRARPAPRRRCRTSR